MKITGLGAIVLPLIVGSLAAAGGPSLARAVATHDYQIAANDGYGLADCLAAGSDCGQVVADAWCEAHGNGHALAYGLRSALDGRPTPISASDESYEIKCGD